VLAMVILNAEKMVLGRLASFAAKKALAGEQVTIVNSEKAVISGSRDDAMAKMKIRLGIRGKGNPEKGPKYSRMPDKVFRKAVRGMLPWKSSRGKEAYRRVHVYIGIPQELAGKAFEKMPENTSKEFRRSVELGALCRLLGAKW